MCGGVKGLWIKEPMLPEAERDIGDAGGGSEMEALGLLWGWTLPEQHGPQSWSSAAAPLHFPARQR